MKTRCSATKTSTIEYMSLMMIPGDSDRPHYDISSWWERGGSMRIATETPQNEMACMRRRSKHSQLLASCVFFLPKVSASHVQVESFASLHVLQGVMASASLPGDVLCMKFSPHSILRVS